MNGRSFPCARQVRELVDRLAADCREVSLLPNARLGYGVNAVGILEEEISPFLQSNDELALVLKFAAARGAIEITRDYGQGGQEWCIIELSGRSEEHTSELQSLMHISYT